MALLNLKSPLKPRLNRAYKAFQAKSVTRALLTPNLTLMLYILGGESCVKWACFFMLPPLNCICHYKLRRDIKSDFGVDQGGCIRDALAVTFCACCAIIQDWLKFELSRSRSLGCS